MKILRMIFLLGLLFGNITYANDVAPNLNENSSSDNNLPVDKTAKVVSDLVAVLGYQSAANNELWQQSQVGFGVKNLLEQALLEHSPFSLLDEKVLFGVKNEKIEEDLQSQWMISATQTSVDGLKKLADKHKLTAIFWVKVIDFVSTVSKASIAIFNVSEYQDTLTLEVCRYAVISNSTECEKGEATKSRILTGILYKPTDDVRKNFKHSGAGQLSQDAITKALTKLLKL